MLRPISNCPNAVEQRPREEWRDVPGFVSCQASNRGRVRSRLTGRWEIRPLCRNIQKYNIAWVWQIGASKGKAIGVHRLVAWAFHEPSPGREHVNHKNGIRHDNRPDNLEFCTHRENILHSKALRRLKAQSPKGVIVSLSAVGLAA